MRIKKAPSGIQEGDMTPMIDMTFQLIAFFMVLINFSQSEQNERILLPDSELAKPPEAPLDFPITLHLTKEGSVIIGGQEITIEGLAPYLSAEADVLRIRGKPLSDATIIIRGHREAQTGKVQDLIRVCQQTNFEKFALRAKENVGN
ncbi:MAG: biopolymer transporter ExbD [Planctomycetes bacterium]|nr:biopolymer transporter ExbD [Planctomycetota bacterium]MBL7039935.1 biopolymer transporter ExbD [Pirellulaceae bacterium]